MSNIHTYQVLLEVANMLKELQANPKVLEERVKEAYTLNKTGEDQLKEAHNTIREAKEVTEAQAKQQEILNALAKDLAHKDEELQKLQISCVQKMTQIKKMEEELAQKQANVDADFIKFDKIETGRVKYHDEVVKKIELREAEVNRKLLKLDAEREALDNKHIQVSAFETKLKEHAAKLKAQADTIL